jgi:membrane glycosyltransferase
LILAIFISWATGQLSIGMAFRRIGLLTTPEERAKPPVVVRANQLIEEAGGLREEADDGLAVLYADPHLQSAHLAFMPRDWRHKRGHMVPEWALAQSKLQEAQTIEEVLTWLMPKERMAILNDGALLQTLFALPRAEAQAQRAAE